MTKHTHEFTIPSKWRVIKEPPVNALSDGSETWYLVKIRCGCGKEADA